MMDIISYRQWASLLLVLSMMIPAIGIAGSFKVNPLKLSFSSTTKSMALEVNNTSDKKISVQIETRAWSQGESGKDLYTETKDLLFFPKIVTLAPGAKRIVRVSYRGEKVTNQEKSYRLFVQELVDRSEEQNALNFSLRFSIPVFISPGDVKPNVRLSQVQQSEKGMDVLIENSGKSHSLIKKIQMTGLDDKQKELFFREEKGWYVLPGSTNVFEIPLTMNECRSVASLEFAARGSVETHVTRLNKDRITCR